MEEPPVDYESPIPLFPLPNVVLFPGVVQPLHIFEERYRQMMAWTLPRQKLIALALLKPGWEPTYYARPAVHGVVCIGLIAAHEHLDDGKYNLLLRGIARARVIHERREQLFRLATLEPLFVPEPDPTREPDQRATLVHLLTRGRLARVPIAQVLRELVAQDAPTGLLVDALAYAVVPDVKIKQQLLAMANPSTRAQALLHVLDSVMPAAPPPRQWPPPPGIN